MEEMNGLSCKDTEIKRARERALYILGRRDHSKKELLDKLRRTNSEEASECAVKKMEELGFINDRSYAQKLANDLINRKHLSGQRLKYEMRKKGLDSELIDEVITKSEVDSVEQLRQIISAKYSDCLSDEKKKRRVIATFQRMGHKWEDIRTAMYMECDEFE